MRASPALVPSPYPRRGLGRGFTQADECLSAGTIGVGVLALNLSRRDRNRADLSSDK